jgi:hypothetical protein
MQYDRGSAIGTRSSAPAYEEPYKYGNGDDPEEQGDLGELICFHGLILPAFFILAVH